MLYNVGLASVLQKHESATGIRMSPPCELTSHQFSSFFFNGSISLRLMSYVLKMFVAKISMAKTLPMKTLNIILKMQTLRHKKVQ